MKTIFAMPVRGYRISRGRGPCRRHHRGAARRGGRIRSEEALFGYVWTIAANTYKKYLRRKSRCAAVEWDENRLGEIPDDEDFTETLLQSERLNRLRRELSLLSGQYRECTVAYYFDGLSCAETAEKLHISLEMVKYYLFKTRKILKEGIGMERTFGEKSYKPSRFEFVTIFSGQFNREYRNLFSRKLPGSVLSSAYYTPMTVRELSVELGVAAVYMEDEVALLEKYGLLAALPGGKYQTALVIFTEGYTREFYRSAAGFWHRRGRTDFRRRQARPAAAPRPRLYRKRPAGRPPSVAASVASHARRPSHIRGTAGQPCAGSAL